MKKDLTKITDLTRLDVEELISHAFALRDEYRQGKGFNGALAGKVVSLVFEKPSLRTKVAFEVATASLGGTPIFLSSSQILASAQNEPGRESIPDIAHNLERFVDLIVARVYSHDSILELARSVKVPVINGLCDKHHPTQALADIMAIIWHRRNYHNLSVVFVGDGNNVATSLMQICAMLGLNFSIAAPKGFEIPAGEIEVARELAKTSGSELSFFNSPEQAVKGADIVYTDTFVSMGQEKDSARRAQAFVGFQVNEQLFSLAKPDALFMHCLPAHRGEEVTDGVMDSPRSIVFDQAEARLHIARALLSRYLGKS